MEITKSTNYFVNTRENLTKVVFPAVQDNEKATRVSYRFSILLDKLNDLLKTYDEKRKELVQKHGEEEIKKDDEGNEIKTGNIIVPEKKQEEYFAEISEISSVDLTLSYNKIPLKELEEANVPGKVTWVMKDFIESDEIK